MITGLGVNTWREPGGTKPVSWLRFSGRKAEEGGESRC